MAHPPTQRCSERQRVAKEMLEATVLESNARKLRTLCRDELEHLAQEGRFDLTATRQGSKLYAIVSTMAELLKGDTQLVESINSIVRLIGTRCPNIDLETMSARITTKKAVTGNLSGTGALAKRWTNVLTHAKPLLLEMTSAGSDYKRVLHDVARFSQPTRTSLAALDPALKNTDLAKALPDVTPTPKRKWSSSTAAGIKKALDAAKRESARLKSFAVLRPASMTIICIRQGKSGECGDPSCDQRDTQFFLHATSYRSVLFVLKLQLNEDGSLELPSRPEVTTTLQLLNGLHGACHDERAPRTYEVFAMSALHVKGRQLRCLQDVASQDLRLCSANMFLGSTPVSLIQRRSQASTAAQLALLDAEEQGQADDDDVGVADADLLGSGYGFGEDVAESVAVSAALDTELGTSVVETSNTKLIQQAVSRQGNDAAETGPCNDIGLIEEAMELVKAMHANSNIVLTDAELEEEAVLLVIRQAQDKKNEQKEKSETRRAGKRKRGATVASQAGQGTAEVDETEQLLARRASDKNQPANIYKCLENDAVFLGQILGEEADSDPEADAEDKTAANDAAGPAANDCKISRAKHSLPKSFLSWEKSLVSTLDSWLDRARRCALGIGHQDEVSFLVSVPVEWRPLGMRDARDEAEGDSALELICVRWTDVRKREGRQARVDSQNRVVYAPSHVFGTAVASQSFSRDMYSDVLHACGAQSRRYKGGLRDTLPPAVVRFLAFARLLCSYANRVPRPASHMNFDLRPWYLLTIS